MKQLIFILATVSFVIMTGSASAQTAPTSADSYLAAAKNAVGTDWAGTFLRLCIPPAGGPANGRGGAIAGRGGAGSASGAIAVGLAGASGGRGAAPRSAPARDSWYAEPAKVADNLYFLGTKIHSAWALTGSEGIVIFEALFDYAAKDEILDGLKKLGLDQSKVRYVLLSHAHADHDGGAKLLQDSFPGAHLIYGAEDWDAVDNTPNHAGGKPRRDKVGDDGMVISVGDASVRIVTMPGHTPGTLSFLFEVRDNGKPLRVAYVGGTAIPFNGSAAYYDGYIASSAKMAKAANEFGATALLSNHSEFDDAYFKAHAAQDRKPGVANPFDVGANGVARYFAVVQGCAAAAKIRSAGQ
jgi:metallo-beta-lactamase class B